MANTIDQDVQQGIIDLSGVTTIIGSSPARIHYNHVPESYEGTYIFLRRSNSGDDEDRSIGDTTGRTYEYRESFDVEVVSETLAEAVDLALLLKKLDSTTDVVGTGTCQAVFVRDHSDDYSPKGVDSDAGLFVGSVSFEIINYAEA